MEKDLNFYLTLFSPENLIRYAVFIAKPLIILIIGKFIIGALLKIVEKALKRSRLDAGICSFTRSALRISLWVIALIAAADSVGINTSSLVALVSVITLALSLSVQNIFTNIFSGILILVNRQINVGDYIKVGDLEGTVKSIHILRTVLTTLDNRTELIPNSNIISNTVVNFSAEPWRRVDVAVTVSYDAPTKTVYQAVQEVYDADSRIVRTEEGPTKAPFVRLSGFKANDVEYTLRVWVKSSDYWDVYFDLLENLRESFARHGIEFSYPHVVVHKTEA